MTENDHQANPPTFANGGIPFSAEGIQGVIRDVDDDFARQLKYAEPDLDRLTVELCAADRREGKPVEAWLLKAEQDALNRMRERGL